MREEYLTYTNIGITVLTNFQNAYDIVWVGLEKTTVTLLLLQNKTFATTLWCKKQRYCHKGILKY